MSDFQVPKQALVRALAEALIADESQVRTRVTHLTRMGFPPGSKKGRGYRGGSTIDQLWQTVIVFHLLELGIAPSRAIEMINESWKLAYLGVSLSLPFSDPELVAFWLVAPAGLDQFEPTRNSYGGGGWKSALYTLALTPEEAAQGILGPEGVRTYSVINAKSVVDNVLAALADPELGIDQQELINALHEWVNEPANRLRKMLQDR